MSDYNDIKTATDAKLFMRNNVYNEISIGIFESALRNSAQIDSFSFDPESKICTILGMKSPLPEPACEVRLHMSSIKTSVLEALKDFISHPYVTDTINMMGITLSLNAKELLRKAGLNVMYAATIASVTCVRPNLNDGETYDVIIAL